MLDAAFKALAQMFSRPFRNVLWKSIGLAVILIVIIGIGLHHVLVWLAGVMQGWAEQTIGLTTNMPVTLLAWILSFAATLGIIVGSVLLMPAVTALVASLFVDDPWHIHVPGIELRREPVPDTIEVERVSIEPTNAYQLELENVSDAIRGEARPLLGGRHGTRNFARNDRL